MNVERFKEIRRYYAEHMCAILAEFAEDGGQSFDPYEWDWYSHATPIESLMWQCLRQTGIPMLPQFPARQYFLDFGNPINRIAIECDGRAYHNDERDAERDRNLMRDGWRIYRVPGWQCVKAMSPPWVVAHGMRERGEQVDPDEHRRYCREWFRTTSDGVVMAIGIIYFGKELVTGDYADLARETLDEHRSTGVAL